MTLVKKFLSPTLYPLNRDISRKWFIKYYEEDFINGGFKAHKYVGLLNLEPDKEKRLQLATEYINAMHRGEPLPKYQGQKTIARQPTGHRSNTNVVSCCHAFLKIKEAEGVKSSTLIDYRSKVKIFSQWLVATKRDILAIGQIDKQTAILFLMSLLERGLGNASFNDYKNLLATIWQSYSVHLQHNPWRDIKARKSEPVHHVDYPQQLRQQIAETLPEYNMQLWLFMQCIYYCAIRPHSELRLLQIQHINFTTGTFTVPAHISKNGKTRHVVIYAGLLQQLIRAGYSNYPKHYYVFGLKEAPAEKPVSKNHFQRLWSDYREKHNIPAIYKLYGSKHTAGKQLTKKFNAYITQQHFDHSDLQTTQAYTDGLDKNELKFLQNDYPAF